MAGGGALQEFISPVDVSGGVIACEFVADPNASWDGRVLKAAVQAARYLVRLVELGA